MPDRAAELQRGGHAPAILVTGGFGRMTRGAFDQPEALVFRDRLIGMDRPVEAFAARLVTDLDRLDRYGARGDIARPRPRDPA